ncbi:MAG: VWA domain-containing protein, partial [Gammaproteobacteria bacterium]
IWTYARQVNNLLPVGTVNAQWKDKASQAVKTLGGYGPYANLPNALSDATYAWRNNGNKGGGNVILLTDNGVKTSNNATTNKAAQEDLTQKLVPQLQKNGVKVYVVAFKDADEEMLKQLASDTKGDFQQVGSPAELNSAFTHLQSSLGIAGSAEPSVAASSENVTPEPFAIAETAQVAEPQTGTATEVAPAETVMPTTDESQSPLMAENTTNNSTELNSNPSSETPILTESNVATSSAPLESTQPSEIAALNTEENAGLGEAESDEIRVALAKAETELQDLLNEYSATNQNDQSPAATLSGQQLSEPLVITLNDGSVLVTSDQSKADAMTETHTPTAQNNDVENPASSANASTGAGINESSLDANHGLAPNEQEITPPAEWTAANTAADTWPLVLTILAVINITIIILLIVGRYFWIRHKRRQNDVDSTLKMPGSL